MKRHSVIILSVLAFLMLFTVSCKGEVRIHEPESPIEGFELVTQTGFDLNSGLSTAAYRTFEKLENPSEGNYFKRVNGIYQLGELGLTTAGYSIAYVPETKTYTIGIPSSSSHYKCTLTFTVPEGMSFDDNNYTVVDSKGNIYQSSVDADGNETITVTSHEFKIYLETSAFYIKDGTITVKTYANTGDVHYDLSITDCFDKITTLKYIKEDEEITVIEATYDGIDVRSELDMNNFS